MMLKLQLQQPAAVVILSNIKTNTPKQCSTKKMASELATSSSSIAAVGETAARLAIEPRSPHGRHGERERRGQPLPASVFAPCWEVSQNGAHYAEEIIVVKPTILSSYLILR